MSTDIHALDTYIGQYVDLTEGKDGASGFIVDVSDDVEYRPEPVRWVTLDYGYGFPVSADTDIVVVEPPEGEQAPEWVKNPMQVMHAAMHADGVCAGWEQCVKATYAYSALRAFRAWQMKQADAYWKHTYVERLKGQLGDPVSTGDLIRAARDDGAPPHVIDRMQRLVDWHRKEEGK